MKLHSMKKDERARPLSGGAAMGLDAAPAGSLVRILAFGDLPPASLQHLQAYGLLPGREVKVLARRPLTIILVEQTELALERSVASQVLVEGVQNPV